MADLTSVRMLVAPCGCVCAADATNDYPGFCRSKSEAAEDARNRFTERHTTADDARDTLTWDCKHRPKWGVA